jgi:hypothetical protein
MSKAEGEKDLWLVGVLFSNCAGTAKFGAV